MSGPWGDRPYHSLDFELKKQFGHKVYKLALSGGMTCPNRDGTLGRGGCVFCSEGGSGEFAQLSGSPEDVGRQVEAAKARVRDKVPENAGYIAYFQSFTNTYAPVSYLEALFTEAIRQPGVEVLSVATRPDCLEPEKVELLARLNREKPVWVELGLQTMHPKTAREIRRGYELPVFEDAFARLKQAGLTVVVHVILGLPGESRKMMLDTVRYVGHLPADGIKLQLLHVLKGTDLAVRYEADPFPVMTLSEYADLVADCIALLPESVVIHRISGDGPKRLLLAPEWSGDKKNVLNTIGKRLKERKILQGMLACS